MRTAFKRITLHFTYTHTNNPSTSELRPNLSPSLPKGPAQKLILPARITAELGLAKNVRRLPKQQISADEREIVNFGELGLYGPNSG